MVKSDIIQFYERKYSLARNQLFATLQAVDKTTGNYPDKIKAVRLWIEYLREMERALIFQENVKK